MKKQLLLYSLIFLSVYCGFGQEKIKGNRNITLIETELEPFNSIALGQKLNVILSEASKPSISIETDENLHEVINFEVQNQQLIIKTNKRITSKKKLNITLNYTNSLKEITLKDNAELTALNTIRNDSLVLKLTDEAKVDFSVFNSFFKFINNHNSKYKFNTKTKLNVESKNVILEINDNSKTDLIVTTDSLKVNIKENASIDLNGKSEYLELAAHGISKFKGKTFTSKHNTITTEGKSEVSIHALETISISAKDESRINLYGKSPKIELLKFENEASLFKKAFKE